MIRRLVWKIKRSTTGRHETSGRRNPLRTEHHVRNICRWQAVGRHLQESVVRGDNTGWYRAHRGCSRRRGLVGQGREQTLACISKIGRTREVVDNIGPSSTQPCSRFWHCGCESSEMEGGWRDGSDCVGVARKFFTEKGSRVVESDMDLAFLFVELRRDYGSGHNLPVHGLVYSNNILHVELSWEQGGLMPDEIKLLCIN